MGETAIDFGVATGCGAIIEWLPGGFWVSNFPYIAIVTATVR
jgi:hypothetical protein